MSTIFIAIKLWSAYVLNNLGTKAGDETEDRGRELDINHKETTRRKFDHRCGVLKQNTEVCESI